MAFFTSPLSYSGYSWLCVCGVYGSASAVAMEWGGPLYMVFGTMSVCEDEKMFLLHKQASESVLLEVISTNQLYCVKVLVWFC